MSRCEHIIFGFHGKNTNAGRRLAINLIVIFGKFHIHKCKFLLSWPFLFFFTIFVKGLELELSTISKNTKKKKL